MKTKLETKFKKQSKSFLSELKASEMKYEKFLKHFIKNEIIGKKNFNEFLNDEIDCVGDFFNSASHELFPCYLKNIDYLEEIISFQIMRLEDGHNHPDEESEAFELALAKERE